MHPQISKMFYPRLLFMMNPNNSTATSTQSPETLWNNDRAITTVETVPKKIRNKTLTGLQSNSKVSFILSSIQTEDFMKNESIIKAAIRSQHIIKKICHPLPRNWTTKNHSRSIKKSSKILKNKYSQVWISKISNFPNRKHKILPKLSAIPLKLSPKTNLWTQSIILLCWLKQNQNRFKQKRKKPHFRL